MLYYCSCRGSYDMVIFKFLGGGVVSAKCEAQAQILSMIQTWQSDISQCQSQWERKVRKKEGGKWQWLRKGLEPAIWQMVPFNLHKLQESKGKSCVLHRLGHSNKIHNCCSSVEGGLVLFPCPTQLSINCRMEKWERGSLVPRPYPAHTREWILCHKLKSVEVPKPCKC